MRIGLLGFTFVNANMGCEALTYSFMNILQEQFGKSIEVCYFSYSNKFGQIQKFFPDIKFSYQPLTRKDMLFSVGKRANMCDVIFDISYGDGFSDIYNPKGVFRNTLIKQIVCFGKTPLVLLPQTYGPFKNKLLENQASNAIKHSAYVFSRDDLSSEYVNRISGIKPITVTDLAFALPFEKKTIGSQEKLKIGINVSGLLWRGGFYKENQFGLKVDYREYITRLIEMYYGKSDVEIHLIPHVMENIGNSNDGDLFVNEILQEKYPDVICAPAFDNPIDTKNYIASMDVMTAARMHATVDSFSAGVPVVPFAYSRKFEGLYGSLGYDYLVDGCRETTESAFEKTVEYISRKDELKNRIELCKLKIDGKNEIFSQTMSIIKNQVCIGE